MKNEIENNTIINAGDDFRRYTASGSGKWTSYRERVVPQLWADAVKLGWAVARNDAPRGGKLGEHYLAKRRFSALAVKRELNRRARRLARDLAAVCPNTELRREQTVSDIGSFVIDGRAYSNYYGDGLNQVRVCEVDAAQFRTDRFVSRREVYDLSAQFYDVRFDEPRTVRVAKYDCEPDGDSYVFDNVVGFAIWSRVLKIFVAKK